MGVDPSEAGVAMGTIGSFEERRWLLVGGVPQTHGWPKWAVIIAWSSLVLSSLGSTATLSSS
jgi:hypothetical protein